MLPRRPAATRRLHRPRQCGGWRLGSVRAGHRGSSQPREVGPRARRLLSSPRPRAVARRGGPRRKAPLPNPSPPSPRVWRPWAAAAPGLLPVFQAAPQHLASRTVGDPGLGPKDRGSETPGRARGRESPRARPTRRRGGPGVSTATRRAPARSAPASRSAEGREVHRSPPALTGRRVHLRAPARASVWNAVEGWGLPDLSASCGNAPPNSRLRPYMLDCEQNRRKAGQTVTSREGKLEASGASLCLCDAES